MIKNFMLLNVVQYCIIYLIKPSHSNTYSTLPAKPLICFLYIDGNRL